MASYNKNMARTLNAILCGRNFSGKPAIRHPHLRLGDKFVCFSEPPKSNQMFVFDQVTRVVKTGKKKLMLELSEMVDKTAVFLESAVIFHTRGIG